jgi:HAD superfamily hydrolase (TIGR01509 family)
MNWVKDFNLFLFDFDGLLVNTEELHFLAYRKLCEARGFELKWSLAQFFEAAHLSATGIREGLRREFPRLFEEDWDVLYREKKEIYQRLLEKGEVNLLPGVAEILMAIQDKKRCVVTNSTKGQIMQIRKHNRLLDSIPVWITREDYKEPKPHPECYQKALSQLKEPGDRVIGFEDSARGLKAMEGAGVEVKVLICFPDHPQLKEREFSHYFPSFDVIVDIH